MRRDDQPQWLHARSTGWMRAEADSPKTGNADYALLAASRNARKDSCKPEVPRGSQIAVAEAVALIKCSC